MSKLRAIEGGKNACNIGIAIPDLQLEVAIYSSAELQELLNSNRMKSSIDCETGRKYWLFYDTYRCLDDNLGQTFAAIREKIANVFGIVEKALVSDNIRQKDAQRTNGDFWRIVIEIRGEMQELLDDINVFFYEDPHDSHIRLQRFEDYGIIRVKARTFQQLRKITEMLYGILDEQI